MKRIYVSLPMKDHEDTVAERYLEAKRKLEERFKCETIEVVGPCNINEFIDKTFVERNEPWEWFIGEDVKILLTCTHICMTDGWEASRGCCLEYMLAKHEGLKILVA